MPKDINLFKRSSGPEINFDPLDRLNIFFGIGPVDQRLFLSIQKIEKNVPWLEVDQN